MITTFTDVLPNTVNFVSNSILPTNVGIIYDANSNSLINTLPLTLHPNTSLVLIYQTNYQGLCLQAVEQLVIVYYSYEENQWMQADLYRPIESFIYLPASISVSQVQSVTASAVRTEVSDVTPCQVSVISDVEYSISYQI